jgi:hypothetical protein
MDLLPVWDGALVINWIGAFLNERSFALEYTSIALAQIICEENRVRVVHTGGKSLLRAVVNTHITYPSWGFRKFLLDPKGMFPFRSIPY